MEDETLANEKRIAELTEALMVPTFVCSLAERWKSSAEAQESNDSKRAQELTITVESMGLEMEILKQQLQVIIAHHTNS